MGKKHPPKTCVRLPYPGEAHGPDQWRYPDGTLRREGPAEVQRRMNANLGQAEYEITGRRAVDQPESPERLQRLHALIDDLRRRTGRLEDDVAKLKVRTPTLANAEGLRRAAELRARQLVHEHPADITRGDEQNLVLMTGGEVASELLKFAQAVLRGEV